MMTHMDPKMLRILRQMPGGHPSEYRVSPLEGGITNRNYRVERGGESFVLRIGGENTEALGIDRDREYHASCAAAGLGVGAEVLLYVPEERAMVTRFVSGTLLTAEAAARTEVLRRIVASIRAVHDGPAFLGEFWAPDVVRQYRALAESRGVSFPTSAGVALATMERIEASLGRPAKLVPCHNDLLAANMIDDGATVRILDWEYAAQGDPFFDLGNFAVNQKLDAAAERELLHLYRGRVSTADEARLRLHRLLSDLRESYWGFLQSGVSTLEFDFRKYALDHLERFQKNVAVPELEEWLRAAKIARSAEPDPSARDSNYER